MWGGSSGLRREYSNQEERPRWPMHNIDSTLAKEILAEHPNGESSSVSYGSPVDGAASPHGGTWGERDVGGPMSQRMYAKPRVQARMQH